MAAGIRQVGDAGLEIALDFPDTKMRDDFDIAFRGWVKQYQQTAATHRLVSALALEAGRDESDTSGFLFRSRTYWTDGSYDEIYVDLIPVI